MCLVESITYVYPDGRRLHQPYHNLCDGSHGGRPCQRARYHDLGERLLPGAQTTPSRSSLEGYATMHRRPTPPPSDTTGRSRHSRSGSSQDSTNWKGAFTRPARKLSLFGRRDSVKDSKDASDRHRHKEVVVDQLSPPLTPQRDSILQAPPVISHSWSDSAIAPDKMCPTDTYGRHAPSIRPVSYAGEPRYEIRTPTGSTPTGSTPPEGKKSKRTSRNYSTTQIIQDPPVRPPDVVHGVYTPRSSWNTPESPSSKDKVTGGQATAVPPPPPAHVTPAEAEATPHTKDDEAPYSPTEFSTEPEVSRFQHRETQRRLAAQQAHQTHLESEIASLRAQLARQDAADQAAAAERQRVEEQQRAEQRRERTFRERQEAAAAAAAAARAADNQYKETAQRVAQLQAEVDELRLRRHVVEERFADHIDADTRAASRHMRSTTVSTSPHDDRPAPRFEGHRTRDGRVVWTETDRATESSRPVRRSEGRAAQRNRQVRETLDNLTIGSEEAVESEDGDEQGSHGHGHRRRRRRRRHHRGHREHHDDAA